MRGETHLKVVVLKFRLTVEPVVSFALRDIQKSFKKTAAMETIEPAA